MFFLSHRALNQHTMGVLESVMRELDKSELEMQDMYRTRQETGDVVFCIDANEISAHRAVLAAISPKYRAQFFGPMAEKGRVMLENISPAAFEEFLQFFYVNDVKLSRQNIEDVFDLCNQSLSEEIIFKCVQSIIEYCNEEVIWMYQLALFYQNYQLKNHSENLICENFSEIAASQEFVKCDRDLLCEILDLELLSKEITIFEACIQWAKQNSNDHGSLRAALGAAVTKIRFCSMSTEEIITIGKKYSGFLTQTEILDIIESIEKDRLTPCPIQKGWHPIHNIIDSKSKNGKVRIGFYTIWKESVPF